MWTLSSSMHAGQVRATTGDLARLRRTELSLQEATSPCLTKVRPTLSAFFGAWDVKARPETGGMVSNLETA
jgi:hypothetical protein